MGVPRLVLAALLALFSACGRIGFDFLDQTSADGGDTPASCSIEGSRIAEGTSHPTDSCLVCDPSRSDVDWSVASGCDPRIAGLLTAADGDSGDSLGWDLGVSATHLVVGARHHSHDGQTRSGAAYVFAQRADGSWAQEAELLAEDSDREDWFGQAVDLSGTRAIIGTWRDYSEHTAPEIGTAYIFERQADGTWSQVAQLFASDGVLGDNFGLAVAVAGDIAAVGARRREGDSGAVYIFERQTDGGWLETAKVRPSDPMPNEQCGKRVELDGQRLVASCVYGRNANGDGTGAAYVFERNSDGSWSQEGKLLGSDGGSGDDFSEGVALDGDRVVVGAPHHDHGGLTESGAAYVFERQADGTWVETAELVGLAPDDNDGFEVAVLEDRAIVRSVSGVARVFDRQTESTWQDVLALRPPTNDGGLFGFAIEMQGGNAYVTEPRYDTATETERGALHIFQLPP